MFDQELDYYGITSFKDHITDQGSHDGGLRILASFVKANREYEMHLLSVECYNKFCLSYNAAYAASGASASVIIPPGHKLYNVRSLDSEEKKLLDEYLHKYFGLMVHDGYLASRAGGTFVVRLKK